MPRVPFASLPDDARLWVFAAADPVTADRADTLLREVDDWLDRWQAHGAPLRCARAWRDDRFLAIGVDQRDAGASGCSIDALFRVFQELQPTIGTSLLGGGRVFYRDSGGRVQAMARTTFIEARALGVVGDATAVFDTTVVTAADWRTTFERSLASSWHARLT